MVYGISKGELTLIGQVGLLSILMYQMQPSTES